MLDSMTTNALEEVDAIVFSGDALYELENLEEFENYLGRWTRETQTIRKSIEEEKQAKLGEVFSNQDLRRRFSEYLNGTIDFKRLIVTQLEDDLFALDIHLDDDLNDYHTYTYATQKDAAKDALELHILSLRENFTEKVEKSI